MNVQQGGCFQQWKPWSGTSCQQSLLQMTANLAPSSMLVYYSCIVEFLQMPTPATYFMDNVFGQCQPVRKEAPSFSFGAKHPIPNKGMLYTKHPVHVNRALWQASPWNVGSTVCHYNGRLHFMRMLCAILVFPGNSTFAGTVLACVCQYHTGYIVLFCAKQACLEGPCVAIFIANE